MYCVVCLSVQFGSVYCVVCLFVQFGSVYCVVCLFVQFGSATPCRSVDPTKLCLFVQFGSATPCSSADPTPCSPPLFHHSPPLFLPLCVCLHPGDTDTLATY